MNVEPLDDVHNPILLRVNEEQARYRSHKIRKRKEFRERELPAPNKRNLVLVLLYIIYSIIFFEKETSLRAKVDIYTVKIEILLKNDMALILAKYLPRIIFSVCSGFYLFLIEKKFSFVLLFFAGYFTDYNGIRKITIYSTVIGLIGSLGRFLAYLNFNPKPEDLLGEDSLRAEYMKYLLIARIIFEAAFSSLYTLVIRELLILFYNKQLGRKVAWLPIIYSLVEIVTFVKNIGDAVFQYLSFGASCLNIFFGYLLIRNLPSYSSNDENMPIDKETCGGAINKVITSRFLLIGINWGIIMALFNVWDYLIESNAYSSCLFFEPDEKDNANKIALLIHSMPYIGIISAGLYILSSNITSKPSKTLLLILTSFLSGIFSWASLVLVYSKNSEYSLKLTVLLTILYILGFGFGLQMVVGLTCLPSLNSFYRWGLSIGFLVGIENMFYLLNFFLVNKLIHLPENDIIYTKEICTENNNFKYFLIFSSALIMLSTFFYVVIEIIDADHYRADKKLKSLTFNLDETDYMDERAS